MRVITLDPGITTGYCLSKIDKDKVYVAPGQEQFTHLELYRFLKKLNPRQDSMNFVCEDFEYRPHQQYAVLFSLEMIGVAKLVAQQNDVNIWMQSAATGKGYYSDGKLMAADVYVKGKPHSMDATRHFMHWFMFGPGYQYNTDQEYQLVEESWLRETYYQ